MAKFSQNEVTHGYFLDKQPSSRSIRLLELDYSGSGTQATTPVGTQTYQVRIVSDVRDDVTFGSNGVTTSSRDTATVEIFPNLRGEYGPDYVGK